MLILIMVLLIIVYLKVKEDKKHRAWVRWHDENGFEFEGGWYNKKFFRLVDDHIERITHE